MTEIINVTRQTISNWELDLTQPNPEQLKLLSQTFNISIDAHNHTNKIVTAAMGYKFEALNSNNEVIYEESYGFLMFAIGGGIQPGGTYEFSVEIKDDAAVSYIKTIGVSYNNVKISYSSVKCQE